MPGIDHLQDGQPGGQVSAPARSRRRTCSRGSKTAARPAVASRSGPSYGATTTTRAPTADRARGGSRRAPGRRGRRRPRPTRRARRSTAAPRRRRRSASVAPPDVAASIVPAVSAVPRPATQITVRGGESDRSESKRPSSSAARDRADLGAGHRRRHAADPLDRRPAGRRYRRGRSRPVAAFTSRPRVPASDLPADLMRRSARRPASTSSVVRASTFSRSSGSVLDVRRLNQLPSPRSTVTPSRWSMDWIAVPNDLQHRVDAGAVHR